MKRIFAFVLVIVIFSAFAIPCFAQGEIVNVKTTLSKKEIKEGETFTAVFGVQSPVTMSGVQLVVFFDTSRVQLLSVKTSKGDATTGDIFVTDDGNCEELNKNGRIMAMYVYNGNNGAMSKSDAFLTLEFKAADKCVSGNLSINPTEVVAGDIDGNAMLVSKNSEYIYIKGSIPESSSSSDTSSDATSNDTTSNDTTSNDATSNDTTSNDTASNDSTDSSSSQGSSTSSDAAPDNLTKPDSVDGLGLGLSHLFIEGIDFKFDPEITEYKVYTKEDNLEISGIAVDEKASITIEGAQGLKDGKNVITITVVDSDGKSVKYIINAYKNVRRLSVVLIIGISAAALVVIAACVIAVIKFKNFKKEK